MGRPPSIVFSPLVAALAAACILLSNCSQPAPSIPPVGRLFPSANRPPEGDLTAQKVDFNLDGTPSMQGFARPKDGKFAQLLQDLDLSLTQNWQRNHIHYHRFGSIVEDIRQEPFYVAASQDNFFKTTKDYSTTRIDTVFRKSAPGGLTIVMTDLFEQNLDIGGIEEALRSASFPANASLAIWQWELGFSGPIYDFDFRASQGSYYTGSRPLYMLALGSDRSLATLHAAIDKTVTGARPHFLLISKNVATDPRNWLSVTQTSNLGLRSRSVGDSEASPYLVYRTSHGCTTAALTATSRLTPVPDSAIPQFLAHAGAFDATLFSVAGKSGSWSANPIAHPKINTGSARSGGSAIKVDLDCSVLDSAPLTLLRIQRIGTSEDIALPEWVGSSSANVVEFNAAFRGKQTNWGDKTLNLVPLIRGLANTAADGAIIASAYVYFVKS